MSRLRRVRRKLIVLVALTIGAMSLVAAGCQPSDEGIATGTVGRATVTEVVDVPASVTAKAVATLTAPAEGAVTGLPVAAGSPVAKGDVVAVIDSPAARQRLADAEAALAANQGISGGVGSLDLVGLQRSLDVWAADAVEAVRSAAGMVTDEAIRTALLAQADAAQVRYDAAAAASRRVLRQLQQGFAGLGQAVAALGAVQQVQAKAAYDLALTTVEALTLRAPIAGVVQLARPAAGGSSDPLAALLGAAGGSGGARSGAASTTGGGLSAGVDLAGTAGQATAGVDDVLAVGDLVAAGTAVVTIVDISEIGLVGEVDETDVLLVAPGVGADVDLDAAPGHPYTAAVSTIDLLPTPSARGGVAYRVRLGFQLLAAAQPAPRPGMSAVAHLRVREAVDAVAVPAAAVFTSGAGEAVWLVRDGAAVRQDVTLGVRGEDLVQVLSGLTPGERVVVSGTDKVTAGRRLS